jgi:hypothetical protein
MLSLQLLNGNDMQELRLELSHLDFFCPVTGQRILSYESYAASPATVFTYLDELGDFEDVIPEFRTLFDEVQDDIDDHGAAFEGFKNRVENDSIVCFSITTRGMSCGPASSTVRIGINMDYVAAESNE